MQSKLLFQHTPQKFTVSTLKVLLNLGTFFQSHISLKSAFFLHQTYFGSKTKVTFLMLFLIWSNFHFMNTPQKSLLKLQFSLSKISTNWALGKLENFCDQITGQESSAILKINLGMVSPLIFHLSMACCPKLNQQLHHRVGVSRSQDVIQTF